MHLILGKSRAMLVIQVIKGYVGGGGLLNEVEHNGLGDHVDHGSLDDVEVGRNKQLCRIVSRGPVDNG